MDFDRPHPREPHRYARYERLGYPDEGPGGRRVLMVLLAIFWLGAGISLIGAAGYLYWQSKQSEGTWVYVRPTFENNPEVAVLAAERGPSPLGQQEFSLVIDKIGVNAPVAPYGLAEDGTPEVPYEGGVVAWYTFSAFPGTGENAVFAGHYTWNGDAVFRNLGDLAIGDPVVLRGADGRQLIYRVSDNQIVDPALDTARDWMASTGTNVITLITCAGDHFELPGTVAGGGYTHRQVVRAEFVAAVETPAVSG